jgi:hypothetical protein
MPYTLHEGVFIVRTHLFVSSHHLTHTEYRKTFARRNVPTKPTWSTAQYIRFVLYDHPVFGERYCAVRMPNFLSSSVSLPYVHIFFDSLLFSFSFFLHILNVSEFRRVRDQVLHPSKQERCTISKLILYFYKYETKIAQNVQISTVFNSAVCKCCVSFYVYMHYACYCTHTYIQHTYE